MNFHAFNQLAFATLKSLTQKLARCAFAIWSGAVSLAAAEFKGIVTDSSLQPIAGAQVAVVTPAGVVTVQITDDRGAFDIYISPIFENVQLRVAATGFQTTTVGIAAAQIQLTPASLADSVRAPGSAIDSPAAVQGSGVSAVNSQDLRGRNEALVGDLLRETPGVILNQSGGRGSPLDLSIRGTDPRDTSVLLNGIPVNSFYRGGSFNLAQLPSDLIEQVDIARGPQSAIYGSYASGGVVNVLTRAPENGAAFDALAEGGTHAENRVALSGSGMPARDFGIAGSLSHFGGEGAVRNADYVNDSIYLSASQRWLTQNLFIFGDFDSGKSIEQQKNNTSTYGMHWQDGITDNVRADLIAGFFLDNDFSKDIRAYAEGRATWSINSHWILAGGYVFDREETRGNALLDASGRSFLLRRDDHGIYLENRIAFGRFHINAALREDIYQTSARLDDKLSPKISGLYTVDKTTSAHASYATGVRPRGGAELVVIIRGPSLLPQRTESYDFGLTKRVLGDRASIDATWFHNRYKDDLTIAKAQGADISGRMRVTSWFGLTANYMFLESDTLGLYQQSLVPRPKHSGSLIATLHYKKLDANLLGYFRTHTLQAQPVHSYEDVGLNLNYRVKGNLTVYGNLRNALDQRYQEVYGYPSPLLNFVAGVKWSLARAR